MPLVAHRGFRIRLALEGHRRLAVQFLKALEFALLQELLYGFQMLPDYSRVKLVELGHKPVKEITVMGNNQQGAVILLQGLLEYVLGLDVHVVGRLVEGQKVMVLKHQLGHPEPGPFATAEHGHLLVNVFAAEEELGQQVPYLSPDIPNGNSVYGLKNGN